MAVFVPAVYRCYMTEPVFLLGLAIVATGAVMVAKAIAGAIAGARSVALRVGRALIDSGP